MLFSAVQNALVQLTFCLPVVSREPVFHLAVSEHLELVDWFTFHTFEYSFHECTFSHTAQ